MRRLPSTDLFFRHACSDWLSRWWRKGPVSAVGANCFTCGRTMLLIRQDDDAVMRRALDWPHRLVYLVDDDIAGAASSPGLPAAYRRRLCQFDRAFHQSLLHRADVIVVPSPVLAETLSLHGTVELIDPFWSIPPGATDHFGSGPLRIAHLGSGSHGGGLAPIAPALRRLAETTREIEITCIGRAGDHPALEGHPRIRRIAPMRWPRYRRWLARQRFHLALYPLAQTRFDRARSANKLLEHAIVGAAGLYPQAWAMADRLGDAALRAPDDPHAWEDMISSVVADPKRLEKAARSAQRALQPLFSPRTQQKNWERLLSD